MTVSNQGKYFSASFDTNNQNLRTYYHGVVKGNFDDKPIDTPFAKGESTDQMISGWLEKLESIHEKWPSLFDFEIDLAKKVGPMSCRLPLKDRIKDIDSYYEGILLPSEELDPRAIASVVMEFRSIRGLRPRSERRTVELMKKSTNSGSPFFTKRRLVTNSTIPCWAFPDANGVEQFLNGQHFMAAAVLGWRGQEGGRRKSDVKQRTVWMFPYAVNIRELMVYQPLIEACQGKGLVPAWVSMEAVDRRLTTLFDSKGSDDLVVCTDFSAFDQHFNPKMQSASEEILNALFTRDDVYEEWSTNVYPIKYMIPLAYDWGKVRFGAHGMGSGSGGTNCDETLAHRALQYEAALTAGKELNPNSQCLGDDGVLTYPGITVEDVVDAYTSHGLEMNHDKQYASTQDCVYLRRWHHKDYRVDGVCAGVYSTCRALGRLRYMERWQDPEYWDAKAVALRELSILENCKYHPLKEEFVAYCMKRDKYRLGIDIPHFLDNVEAIAREKIEHMPDFLGFTKSLQYGRDSTGGIRDWWIVQYLKSQR